MQKSLDIKLADIKANPSTSKAFIIADAKDADMAFGITAPGQRRPLNPERVPKSELRFRSLEEYRQQIREIVRQGLVDIMLCSASNVEQLAIKEKLFENSPVTPAARANDATDIWVVRGGTYTGVPSRPFATATIDHIQCGKMECSDGKIPGANLGLYSVTFTNNLDHDYRTLEAFKEFRLEAEKKGFKYFLEVFDPNVDAKIPQEKLHEFINDHIIRALAGVTEAGRPQFLKIAYHGPAAMEELAKYDRNLVVGILGGSAGTTYDAFKLIAEAQKYGGRVALFGRKINSSEHPLTFVEMLRRIVNGEISPEEAVRVYHAVLEKLKITPFRSLNDDLQITSGITSYGGSGSTVPVLKPGQSSAKPAPARTSVPSRPSAPAPSNPPSTDSAKRVAEQLARLRKRFGE